MTISSRMEALPRALSALDSDALTVLRLSVYGRLSEEQLSRRLRLPGEEVAELRMRALRQLEDAVGGGPVEPHELHRAFHLVDAAPWSSSEPARHARPRLARADATLRRMRARLRRGRSGAPLDGAEPDARSAVDPARPRRVPETGPAASVTSRATDTSGPAHDRGMRFTPASRPGSPQAQAPVHRPAPDARPPGILPRKAPPVEAPSDGEVIALGRAAPGPVAYPRPRRWYRHEALLVAGIVAVGVALRVWHINALGLNSDEAVYAGQGASIAGVHALEPFFPTFRAHPLLFQTLLSIGFKVGSPELFGRLAAAAYGIGTVLVTWRLGRLLYGRTAGLVAALLLALMPYHVVVSRQILLDGPMVFWSTVALYLVARYAITERVVWLYAAGAGMGLTILSKEGSIILLGSVYAFFALTPELKTRWRPLIGSAAVFALIVSAFPLALRVAGATHTGGNFLAWQLFRRPNHTLLFYPTVVPLAIGLAVVAAAALGVWLLRRDGSWRETLLMAWIAVPVAFFQLFPIKGFQYLLPIAPAVAVLAARFLVLWELESFAHARRPAFLRDRRLTGVAIALVAATLAFASWTKVQPSNATTFLAGSGGVPGGREAGRWIDRNIPVGAHMMSVGPSMANILQFYGHRKILGLSVSPNPLHRNPVYEAMPNPDRLIRDNELQYVVWDAFSADRTPFFSRKLLRYVERYNGTVAHSQTVAVRTADGAITRKPVITIYEVRP